jgi:hypothetical protein
MTHLAILAATAMALAATPSTAQLDASQPKADKPAAAAKDTQYCIKYDDTTGSHISKQECHTRKEWARLGVDLDEMLKK